MTRKSRYISGIIILISTLIYNIVCIAVAQNFGLNYYVKIVCFGLNIPLITTSIFCLIKNYKQAIRWLISISIILCISSILYYIIIKYNLYSQFNSTQKIQDFLQKYGVYASLIYILIQFLQVTFIPIPAAISTMAGVAIFGVWKTFIYSVIGIMLGSMFAFYLGKKYGNKLIVWLFGERLSRKYKNFSKGKDKIVLTMMFVFPFFPDDLLCIAAGVTNMTYLQFFIIMLIIRPLNILAMEGAFKSMLMIPFNGLGIVIWILIISVILSIIIVGFKYSGKIEKFVIDLSNKISKKIKSKISSHHSDTITGNLKASKSCFEHNNIYKKKT